MAGLDPLLNLFNLGKFPVPQLYYQAGFTAVLPGFGGRNASLSSGDLIQG